MATTAFPDPAQCQQNFEQAVALSLHLWPALTLAVQNEWGGPDSADKRDWFAGAIADLFPDVSRLTPAQLEQKLVQQAQLSPEQQASATVNGVKVDEPDQEDVEAVLLQVMLDEFEVAVEDDSAYEVAEQVVKLRKECLRGKFDGVEALRIKWEARGSSKNCGAVFQQVKNEDDEDEDDDDEDEETQDGDGDVEMEEAPELVATNGSRRERPEPVVDEDGFTLVTRKKR